MPFIDARTLGNEDIAADIGIVGAGAAGITIARALAGSRLSVALIESGDVAFQHRSQRLYHGSNIGRSSYALARSRWRTFGGSTTRWGGQCRPLDPIDFEARSGRQHTGWPFDRAHLEPFYARAAAVCDLPSTDFGLAAWSAEAGEPPTIASAALDTRIYQFSRSRDFGIAYRDELARAGNLRVYLNANLVAIETGASGGEVAALELATFGGSRPRLRARRYVLACGGIENARLMLASNRVERAGVGNRHDLVGRYFMDHPFFWAGHLEPAASGGGVHAIEDFALMGSAQRINVGFGLPAERLRAERLNGASVYLVRRPGYKAHDDYVSAAGTAFNSLVDVERRSDFTGGRTVAELLRVVRGSPAVARVLGRQLAHRVRPRSRLALRAAIETAPDHDSRVTLGPAVDAFGTPRARVDWRVGSDDQRGLNALLATMRAEFARRGIGSIVEHAGRDQQGWPMSMTSGKHHIGTTRMHDDPAQGVVDAHCRVHGMSNLYVAGSSVFPTAGYANPTLTIVALALRLADRLAAGA